MNSQELEKYRARLRNQWPLLGPWLRRKAVQRLAADGSADAVPLLVETLEDSDEQVRVTADAALRSLGNQAAMDRLCALWVERRDPVLTALLREKRYVAAQPLKVRALSSLLARQPAADAEAVPLLVEALKDTDTRMRATADAALRSLKDQTAMDRLCALWVEKRDPVLTALLREKRYVATQPVKVRVLSSLLAQQPATDADAVPLLVETLKDPDAQMRATADAALRSLNQAAMDRLCALWVEKRDPVLTTLLREKRYVAAQPVKVRVLSSLLAQQPATDAEGVPLLVEALKDPDAQVRSTADTALRELRDRDSVDVLCSCAIREPNGPAAEICMETRKRPSDHEEACLLLFVTRRLDEYFQEDFEFQALRQAYDRADEAVKALVMDVVRSGDRRCLGFFGRRKPLSECSEREIPLAIDAALRHRDWARLFRAFQELPMKYGFPLLERFRQSGWEPEQSDLKALYRGILTEGQGEALPLQPPPPKETSPVFERWLAEGRTGEYSRLGEAELTQRLAGATPPEGVKIAAALVGKAPAGGSAARAVGQHAHWLVRLAGHATGLCADLARDRVEDGNYWVNELVRSVAVLDFWPAKAAPSDLERLNAAPREAFTGKYGAIRRVLRLLLAHRVTTPEMTEVVFDAGEFAAEFTEAG